MIKKYLLFAAAVTLAGVLNAQTSATADDKYKKGDFAGALKEYDALVGKIDADAQALIKKRDDYAKMSEFEKASMSDASAMLEDKKEWGNLYYGRAMSNLGLGKKNDASVKNDLTYATTLDKTNADAFYQLALLPGMDKDESCADIAKAMTLGSDKAKIAYDDHFCWNQALTHYKEGASEVTLRHFDNALKELDLAIRISPDSGRYYAKRGQAWLGLGKDAKAIEDFSKATEVQPKNADGWYQLGMYYFNKDNHEKAFDYFSKALELDNKNYEGFMNRATCCERLMKNNSAIYDYSMAINCRPNDGTAYYRRALLYQELKDQSNACKDFNIAWKLGIPEAEVPAGMCNDPNYKYKVKKDGKKKGDDE